MSQLLEQNTSDNDNISQAKNSFPIFNFRRMSGLDQATMTTDSDWQNLDQLPQQVWMALSCPIHGLEFDQDTLKMLDRDNDGRIHAQDVKDAVSWVCSRVVHPQKLCESQPVVDMDNINIATEEGAACANALRLVLDKFPGTDNVASLEEIKTVLSEAAGYQFNGDGIVSPDFESNDAAMNDYLYKALAIIGGKKDATGKPGIDQSLADALEKFLKELLNWRKTLNNTNLPLGDNTGEAWTLYCRLKPKLDDYFYRCHLAAFDPSALASLNMGEHAAATTEAQNIFPSLVDQATLEKLPLSRITQTPTLALDNTLNPAWAEDVKKFAALTQPLHSQAPTSGTLDEKSWKAIQNGFMEYAALLEQKPSLNLPPENSEKVSINGFPELALASENDNLKRTFIPLQPNLFANALSDSEIENLLSEKTRNNFEQLIQKDLASPPLSAFQDLYKLALFHAHLYTFLMNFLSFVDFYDPEKKAIFQEGVLYLDSRACHLCVPVEDVDNHARLAAQSHLCLIYCACERRSSDGAIQKANIAAALTLGNVASLIEGRHGLFIDNAGKEWDTGIIKVVHNPISLREAVWAPYIRISNMVAEQAHKFLAARDKAIAEANEKLVANVTNASAQPKPGFDFAKGAGIFAALSVALSVLSAAFAYIANSVASLGWLWPLALIGVFVCISGPSALIAYFKLRKRSLGPLLDASGWAVNQGAPINLAMGMALTTLGKIPPNAAKNMDDPYNLAARMKKKSHWLAWLIFIIFILIVLGCLGFGLYCALIYEPVWVTKARLFFGI